MTSTAGESALPNYCPYDLIDHARNLDLTPSMVQTVFGRTHVITRLRAKAPVTLLIHGVGGTWRSWTPLLQAASISGHDLDNVVIVDLPGFGESQNLLKSLDSALVGQALVQILTNLGYPEFGLVGQSMGAFLALDMAARWPTKISHVNALAGSFRTILDVGQHPLRFALQNVVPTAKNVGIFAIRKLGSPGQKLANQLRDHGVRTIFDELTAHPDKLTPKVRQALGAGFTPRNLMMAAANARRSEDLVPWSNIEGQASFLWGALDPLVPPTESFAVSELVPGARRIVIEDAGHILHIERPIEVLNALAL